MSTEIGGPFMAEPYRSTSVPSSLTRRNLATFLLGRYRPLLCRRSEVRTRPRARKHCFSLPTQREADERYVPLGRSANLRYNPASISRRRHKIFPIYQ